MADRRAVGASIAAAIVFSSLLISNFSLVAGAQQHLRLVSVAAEESDLYNRAAVLESASVVALLDQTQQAISSSSFSCSGARSQLAGLVSHEYVEESLGWVSASSALSLGPSGAARDDLAGVSPFNGSLAGDLALWAKVAVSGETPDSSATLDLSQSHVVSLPVRLSDLTSTCLDAYTAVAATLSALGGLACNSTAVAEDLSSLAPALARGAAAQGFSLGLSYSTGGGTACEVVFTVRVAQNGVGGPEGPFSFVAEESGALS